jgi:hypothetical protein
MKLFQQGTNPVRFYTADGEFAIRTQYLATDGLVMDDLVSNDYMYWAQPEEFGNMALLQANLVNFIKKDGNINDDTEVEFITIPANADVQEFIAQHVR